MELHVKLARSLAKTKLGLWAQSHQGDLSRLKKRPTSRVWLGLGLIAASSLIIPVCLALGWGQLLESGQTLTWLLAGGAVLVVVHLLFALGAYLAGVDYLKDLLRWCLSRFMSKHLA